MFKTSSSSTDSLFSGAQIIAEYDGLDAGGGGGKSVKKFSKAESFQRPEKSAKTIGLEEPSFLTSDTRLVLSKMESSRTHNGELLALLKSLRTRNCKHKVYVRSYLCQIC